MTLAPNPVSFADEEDGVAEDEGVAGIVIDFDAGKAGLVDANGDTVWPVADGFVSYDVELPTLPKPHLDQADIDVWTMHFRNSDQEHKVIDPKMDEEKIAEVSRSLSEIMQGDI